ncbi:MAG TPA: ATP synthase subunit I [Nitrospirota bacterium]|nr:ATP synthase subunit I [Nitrospirota bacterium]
MTDETLVRRQAVVDILKAVAGKTTMLVLPVTTVALAYALVQQRGERWWFVPASILFGALLGLLNFRWLAIAVERVYLRKGATAVLSSLAAAVISVLKLALIFIILFVVMKWHLVHIFGLVGGLSLCFLAIVWEGATLMKQTRRPDK